MLCARTPAVDCTPLIREVVGSQGGGEKAFKSLKRPGAHPTVARVDAHSALCGRRVLSRFRV